MGTLAIGRVGLDVALKDPQEFSEDSRPGSRAIGLRGQLLIPDGTLAETKALRSELSAQVGRVVPVTSTTDSTIDGFYYLSAASIDTQAKIASLQGTGLFPFSASLNWAGNTMFQSGLTGATLDNTNSITTAAEPWLAPPVGFTTYTPSRSYVNRTTEDGALRFFRDVVATDQPVWSVSPANFYKGAAEIWMGSSTLYLRAGTSITYDKSTTGWRLDNGLIRVTNTTGGIGVAAYDGATWDTAVAFDIRYNSVDVSTWDDIFILRNDPECVTIRLIQDRTAGERGRYTLDLSLRRGSQYVSGIFSVDSASEIRVARAATDAASSLTGGIENTDTIDGHKWSLGSPDFTGDTTNGGVYLAATTVFKFMVGQNIGNSVTSGNTNQDLIYQYHGHLTEKVRTTGVGALV